MRPARGVIMDEPSEGPGFVRQNRRPHWLRASGPSVCTRDAPVDSLGNALCILVAVGEVGRERRGPDVDSDEEASDALMLVEDLLPRRIWRLAEVALDLHGAPVDSESTRAPYWRHDRRLPPRDPGSRCEDSPERRQRDRQGEPVSERAGTGWSHYWITSSARSSSDGGIVRPSALAVLRLMTSSNLVGCSTGRSAGLAPFRIWSTYVAPRPSI